MKPSCTTSSEEGKNRSFRGKVMATIFWDSRGVIAVDYLARGKTINGWYCTTLLDELKLLIKEKRPHLN